MKFTLLIMEPSKEAIAVRLTRLNRQLLGKAANGNSYSKKVIDRESLLDALTVLYDECNEDCVKKGDELIRGFLDKFRSALAELRRTRVCLSDFEMLQMIGRGHFGDVHLVREKQTGDVYALKSLRKETALSRKGVACYEEERDVLAAGAAPWLVKLQYAFQDHNSLYLVMELCSGGDLSGLLSRRAQPLCERDAAFYIAEVTHALKALHSLGYVHRDVKPNNVLLDRCGHVKLCDFGSARRLSEGGAGVAVGSPQYVAPELLAAAVCEHAVCLHYCRKMLSTAISACDYWSLGVMAFELVTLTTPFSDGDTDSLACTLANIQKYEREENPSPPFAAPPAGPSDEWRSLVGGLLRVQPSKRFHYLDTLQHPALKHLSPHNIREQVPPWVPCVRGPEDASHFARVPREAPQPDVMPFRTRAPFAGQLPFIGFSFVTQEENEEHSIGFSTSHDCTAIDLATYKSAEKLAALRGRELARLQERLAAALASAETATSELACAREQAALHAQDARLELQKEIINLSNTNRRLEKELRAEKEECRHIEKSHNDLLSSIKERSSSDLKTAYLKSQEVETEKNMLKEECRMLESKVAELVAEAERASAAAESARKQEENYKDILEQARLLRHRRLTEINVRAIDTIAKERALRRQTLTGGQSEIQNAVAKISVAESNAMKESRLRAEAERKVTQLEHHNVTLNTEIENLKNQLQKIHDATTDKQRTNEELLQQIKDLQSQLTQEKCKSTTLSVQVKELQNNIEELKSREVAMEEQRARTDARSRQQVEAAEARAAEALHSDTRHRQKVATLEQLVKQLEREVRALEARDLTAHSERKRDDVISDTESVNETDSVAEAQAQAQITLLKEQLQKAESQLQARADEIAALKQEARTANLARWRKEREVTDIQTEAKSAQREVKRLEERLSTALESRRKAEQKAATLQTELDGLKPELESVKKELAAVKERMKIVTKTNETYEAEVDRSRNDILKLKSELQYSEKRRIHSETQEELATRERAALRDEATLLRQENTQLVQNNKALQEACSLLEEQLMDLEKLSDLNEVKNRDLENELTRVREEVSDYRKRLSLAESEAVEGRAEAALNKKQYEDARDAAEHARAQIVLLKERLERSEAQVCSLEDELASRVSAQARAETALSGAASRLRHLQEESSELRTRTHQQHATILQLQAQLADAQEEISAAREAADAAATWWRTRETKAEATIKQQTKLIDFLQAKVEEANRKKCSLGNKLFGKTKRPAATPPLRKANRELRDEVDRLRSRLSAADSNYQPTPKKERPPKPKVNGVLSIDTPDCSNENSTSVTLLWSDGRRDRVSCEVENGSLSFSLNGSSTRASVVHNNPITDLLTKDEALRAFAIKTTSADPKLSQASAICDSPEVRAQLLQQLQRPLGYVPHTVLTVSAQPSAAMWLDDSVAIACSDGLHSLHGPVHLEFDDGSEAGITGVTSVAFIYAVRRAVFIRDGMLLHTGHAGLISALKRAAGLNPIVKVHKVNIPDTGAVTMVQEVSGDVSDFVCVAACGRRVFLLRHDPTHCELKVARSVTVDRAPHSLLLTPTHLYIAGEKPLRIPLPNGMLEPFALDEPTIAAASKKHSPPKAILLIKKDPIEILICYNECGVFVDENGKRTRSEDAKWTTHIQSWAYVDPFLYCVSKDDVVISYINEEAYKLPPCTCDNHSLASSNSECAVPRTHTIPIREPKLLGTTPNGVLISSPFFNDHHVLFVDGFVALRSIGASIESLDSVSLRRVSMDSTSTCQSVDQNDVTKEEEPNTNFLADIRKRATQLRNKNVNRNPDDVIKGILSADVGPKLSFGRRSPSSVSEFSTDSEVSSKNTADLCADMFTRQVRFDQ